jgi:hypothetical protein
MKHSRSIELSPSEQQIVESDMRYWTLDSLPEWYVVGGRCSKCGRSEWIDRHALAKKFSGRVYIASIISRLKCIGCGNRTDNKMIAGKLPR